MKKKKQNYKGLPEAVSSLDPFKRKLVGLLVSLLTEGNQVAADAPRGRITAHDCYDTDVEFCVEKLTVVWDDGSTQRKDMKSWGGEALGACRDGYRPAYLVAYPIE